VNPYFTIVVPVFNRAPSIEIFLRCLENQAFPRERFECVIVDDGSTDGTRAILESYHSGLDVTLLCNRVNQGRSQARNTGWKHARGEFVLFLDSDMLPEPELLKDYADTIADNSEWGVISGGRYCVSVPDDAEVRQSLARLIGVEPDGLFTKDAQAQFRAVRSKAALGQYPSPLLKKLESQLREVCRLSPESLLCGYSLVTSNVVIRRSLLAEHGGFDPFLRRSEDTELGLRLWGAGSRFGFAEGARAYHLYDPRQPDRHMTLAENIAFFYRQPYSLVLLVHLWCLFNAAGGNRQSPLPDDLVRLAQVGQAPIKADLARQVAGLFGQANLNSYSYPRDFMIDYFAETSGGPPEQIEQYLDLALRRGVFTTERDEKTYFDIYQTSNWLRYHTTYEEYCLRFSSYGRTNKSRYLLTGNCEDLALVDYAGTYEMNIPAGMLEQSCEGTLNLALPVEDERQSEVRIDNCFPADLLEYADYAKGMIVGFPLQRCLGEGQRVGYSFQCKVSEIAATKPSGDATEMAGQPRYVQPALNADYLAKAKTLLARMGLESGADPYVTARTIYSWVLDNVSFYETPFPDFFCLDTGFGSCVHQASLFINLCRLAGIPARERCGGILSKAANREETVIETRTRGFSPFTHTWAEFHAAGRGWVPVDFIGWGYGRRLMTAHNVVDENLRAELVSDTALYDDYYFGSLDPFRIHAGDDANKITPYSFPLGNSKKTTATWRQQLLANTRHVLRCGMVASNVQFTGAATSLVSSA
jgi:glycosyltransferase involved in cell wall biosynthesis